MLPNTGAPVLSARRWGQSGQQGGAFGNIPIEVQGESLRTWSFEDPRAEVVQVDLSTIGRPLNATVEVTESARAHSYYSSKEVQKTC